MISTTDATETLKRLYDQGKIEIVEPTEQNVGDALDGIDQKKVREKHHGRVEARVVSKDYELDHGETIAQMCDRRVDLPDASDVEGIYILLVDGEVSHVQPHRRRREGNDPIPQDEVAAVAKEHKKDLADRYARQEILMEVRSELRP